MTHHVASILGISQNISYCDANLKFQMLGDCIVHTMFILGLTGWIVNAPLRSSLLTICSADYKDAMAASAADRIDAESYRALKERTAYWQQWQLLKEEPSPFSPWIAKAPEQEGFS